MSVILTNLLALTETLWCWILQAKGVGQNPSYCDASTLLWWMLSNVYNCYIYIKLSHKQNHAVTTNLYTHWLMNVKQLAGVKACSWIIWSSARGMISFNGGWRAVHKQPLSPFPNPELTRELLHGYFWGTKLQIRYTILEKLYWVLFITCVPIHMPWF